MNIGVTGAQGFLGWHLMCHAQAKEDVNLIPAGRETFSDLEKLNGFARQCDVVVHLAGVNRGDERELAETNVRLAQQLIYALESQGRTPQVLFASSTHIHRNTSYGRSKRECTDLFAAWAMRSGSLFTNLVLPNVFGECGRPFYNSVVSTFCYQLAHNQTPTVMSNARMEQIHAQDVAEQIMGSIGRGDELRIAGRPITARELLDKLLTFKDLYEQHIIPDLRDGFDRDLFNTYRFYLYPQTYPVLVKLHADERGSLFETVKSLNGGQSFLSTTKSGVTRGDHYHTRKVERFIVLQGEAVIQVRRLRTTDVHEFTVSGETPSYVDIPTLHTHNITNVGSNELVTLFWAHELFNPDQPDTRMEKV